MTDLPVTAAHEANDQISIRGAAARDYLALLKPRVMSLAVFTALVGLVVAPGSVPALDAVAALVAIAGGAGAAAALNMWWDADIDAVMTRTRSRPVPAGRVSARAALALGLVLAVASIVALALVANWLSAALLAFTIAFYVIVYTMWLKRRTPYNIVIGGAAGALPPVIGWAAASGTVSAESVSLFAIILVWTPPHFWALGLRKRDEYAKAGVPMLPVIAGAGATRRQILLYTLALAPLGALPLVLGFAGWSYGVVSLLAGGLMVVLAWRVWFRRRGADAAGAQRQLFAFSILYLFLLFAVLLLEAMGSAAIPVS
jgi:protoheme IX farnesyltransferase